MDTFTPLHQRLVYSIFASLFCFCLGLFTLLKNHRSKPHRLFAAYNFCNGFWNLGELCYFLDNAVLADIILRFTALGGALLIPFVLHFVYEIVGVSKEKPYKTILRIFYILGILFFILHQASLLNLTATTAHGHKYARLGVLGPLYPLFVGFFMLGLFAITGPLTCLRKKLIGIKKKQATYILGISIVGAISIGAFFYSLISTKVLWYHYFLQSLVGFLFAYTIFNHHLLPTKIAFKRLLLAVGIYVFIFLIIISFYSYLFKSVFNSVEIPLGFTVLSIIMIGSLFTIGPFLFGFIVRRVDLFQDQTTSQIAHEFKSPLGAIQSAKQILQDEISRPHPNSEKINVYMDMIERNSNRLEQLVTNIINFTKLNEKSNVEDQTEFDVIPLTQKIIAQFPNLRHRLKLNAPDSLIARLSEEGLTQILTNLLSNADRYAPLGEVIVTITTENNWLKLTIQDQGPGVSREELGKLFQPFFRGSKQLNSKGSGLGLTILKRWVDLLGGSVWAESECLGKGLTVEVIIPVQ